MMSMVQQLIMAGVNAERRIDDQIVQRTVCAAEPDSVTDRVSGALGGSTREHERQMTQQLSAARAEVRRSVEQLQAAKGLLACARVI